MSLITQAEVITAAFTRSIQTTQLKANVLEAAEWEYIRPALTENLYAYVVQNVNTFDTIDADITESDGRVITGKKLITDLLKPALAWFVKYMALDDIITEISERGSFQLSSENATPISNTQRQDLKVATLKIATQKLENMVDYIKKQYDNNVTKYDLYKDFTDVRTEDQLIGGMFIEGVTIDTDD